MFNKFIVSFAFAMGLATFFNTTAAHADYLQHSGQIAMLRVHDVGTMYGPDSDKIDVEVVITLKNQPGKAYGFKLRADSDRVSHEAMLDLLRDAFANNWTITINAETPSGKNNGVLDRVWVTR